MTPIELIIQTMDALDTTIMSNDDWRDVEINSIEDALDNTLMILKCKHYEIRKKRREEKWPLDRSCDH